MKKSLLTLALALASMLATNNEVGIEELEITHEGYERTQ